MLKGGIVGFGGVGQHLTTLIRNEFPNAEITAVCNRSKAKLDIARDTFGITQLTHDPEELCSWDLDFVMVLSSNSAHREHVEAAAAAGLPIFCEKPIATNLADADAMVLAAEKAGVPTVVNYSLRFVPSYYRIREICRSGELGDLLSIETLRLRGYGLHASGQEHWAVQRPDESGGWTVHHACHGIDFIYWLAGEFEEVYAQTQTTAPDKGASELVWGMGRLKSGMTAVVGDSVCAAREHGLVVIGTKGQIVMSGSGTDSRIVLTREPEPGQVQQDYRWPTEQVVAGDRKQHHDTISHFFDCITNGVPSRASLRDARHSLAVACAMDHSAQTGIPVRIPAVGETLG
jgi:predicted dehydrogenase